MEMEMFCLNVNTLRHKIMNHAHIQIYFDDIKSNEHIKTMPSSTQFRFAVYLFFLLLLLPLGNATPILCVVFFLLQPVGSFLPFFESFSQFFAQNIIPLFGYFSEFWTHKHCDQQKESNRGNKKNGYTQHGYFVCRTWMEKFFNKKKRIKNEPSKLEHCDAIWFDANECWNKLFYYVI